MGSESEASHSESGSSGKSGGSLENFEGYFGTHRQGPILGIHLLPSWHIWGPLVTNLESDCVGGGFLSKKSSFFNRFSDGLWSESQGVRAFS